VLADEPSKLFLFFERNDCIALKVFFDLCHFCLTLCIEQVKPFNKSLCKGNGNTPGLQMAARAIGKMKEGFEMHVSRSRSSKRNVYERNQCNGSRLTGKSGRVIVQNRISLRCPHPITAIFCFDYVIKQPGFQHLLFISSHHSRS
jgi:hypothetical protein